MMMPILALWLSLAACSGGDAVVVPPPAPITPAAAEGLPASGVPMAQAAGGIAHEIDADPAKRADVLAAHHVDAAAFDRALYDIAADPELTRAYEAARHP
jgi:hypothetical protein